MLEVDKAGGWSARAARTNACERRRWGSWLLKIFSSYRLSDAQMLDALIRASPLLLVSLRVPRLFPTPLHLSPEIRFILEPSFLFHNIHLKNNTRTWLARKSRQSLPLTTFIVQPHILLSFTGLGAEKKQVACQDFRTRLCWHMQPCARRRRHQGLSGIYFWYP